MVASAPEAGQVSHGRDHDPKRSGSLAVGALIWAGQFVLDHNHPSKSCAPSRKDLQATKKIRKMASALGISLLDHLIVGGQRIYSICQGRML